MPAHNEAQYIGQTLGSVQQSIEYLKKGALDQAMPKISVHIGADGCSDNTVSLARQFPMVKVTEFAQQQGKWNTLRALIADASADWIILVDSGTVWPENFLADFITGVASEPSAIALGPAYDPWNAGLIGRLNWHFEKYLKKLEGLCGGPVSLHGATVAYQTEAVKKVMYLLGDKQWMNDDIVIPLMLRSLYPACLIGYPLGRIHDAGGQHGKLDLGRRKRMLQGNLQWAGSLLPFVMKANPVAGIIAMRRIFRVFWAYWLASLAIALALTFHSLILPGLAAVAILIAVSGSVRQMVGAAWVSLTAPYRLAWANRPLEVSWK